MFRLFKFSIVIACCLTTNLSAQFSLIEIGVNGLTCSQCSRSTELSIKRLEFVQDVMMDLEKTQALITLKPGFKVQIEKLAKAVEDAGFSVRYLIATIGFDAITLSENCFRFENRAYQFNSEITVPLVGERQVKFMGRPFLTSTEFKQSEKVKSAPCTVGAERYFLIKLL